MKRLANYGQIIGLMLCASMRVFAQDTTITIIEANEPGDTYAELATALGGSPLEVPDCDHDEPFSHIEEIFDEELDKQVFKFYIHKELDTDRCGTEIDRQRNEIKAYDPSPHYLKAIQREEVTYEWYFRIDEFFQPSSNFTHLFQLKAVGGNDAANPLLTITPRKADPERLELIHGRGNGSYTTVAHADLSLIKGQWVKAFCKVNYADISGALSFKLSLLDETEVLTYENTSIDMWRTGSTFVRPKWGIYRSLNDINSLRDEEVMFADFKITEIGACPMWYEDLDKDGKGDPNNFIYACDNPEGYVQNKADTCHDWYVDADGDELGNPEESLYACAQPTGYVGNANDLNDALNNTILNIDPASDRMMIYPNPTQSYLQISGNQNRPFAILDFSGREVMSGIGEHVNTSLLPVGIYVLKTDVGQVYKFVKQ